MRIFSCVTKSTIVTSVWFYQYDHHRSLTQSISMNMKWSFETRQWNFSIVSFLLLKIGGSKFDTKEPSSDRFLSTIGVPSILIRWRMLLIMIFRKQNSSSFERIELNELFSHRYVSKKPFLYLKEKLLFNLSVLTLIFSQKIDQRSVK